MICRGGAASRQAPGSMRSSARWCACRRPCAPAATIRERIPAGLGRADIEAFLHRLAFLSAGGQLSAYCRVKTCQDAGRVLTEIRSLGLTRSSGPAAGLADDFTLTAGDVPAKADPGEPGRDVPAEIMRQICGHLPGLEQAVSSRETRIAVELLMDTGRRPAEICTLEWDCLARDADGTPVLVYDNAKAHRLRRRLPISEHTATLITEQKLAVRERFPATPPGQLKLLPSRRLNPAGSRPVTEDNLIGRHRIWLDLHGAAAAGRRHRVRQVPHHAVLLPALLRTAAR